LFINLPWLLGFLFTLSGQWSWQEISGAAPEPCSQSTLTCIGVEKAILIGGQRATDLGGFQFSKASVKDSGPDYLDKVLILDLHNWVRLCPMAVPVITN